MGSSSMFKIDFGLRDSSDPHLKLTGFTEFDALLIKKSNNN